MYQLGMKEKNLLGLDIEELSRLAEELGERSFRGRQLFVQIYRRKYFDFRQLTDLS